MNISDSHKKHIVSVYIHLIMGWKQVVYMDGMNPVCFNKSLLKMLPLISPLNIIIGGKQCTQMSMVCCCLHFYFISPLCCVIRITDLKKMEINYRPVTYLPTMYKTITSLIISSKWMQKSSTHRMERVLDSIKRLQRSATDIKAHITGM
jgi:flagellar biosynthesis protein FliQ